MAEQVQRSVGSYAALKATWASTIASLDAKCGHAEGMKADGFTAKVKKVLDTAKAEAAKR